MRQIHNLKTWAEPFDAMVSGIKTWEFRKNDRDYKVGDYLHLMRYDPETGKHTGQALDVEVTYILHGGSFGIPEGYVVMSTPTVNHLFEMDDLKQKINSLQAERDAAIKDITVCCDTCGKDISGGCWNLVDNECTNWQWRGTSGVNIGKRVSING